MDKHLSKFLSLVLRHQPDKIGVILDTNGWTAVDDLIQAMIRHGHMIDLGILKRIVAENDKKRFAFNEDFSKIRANQGHSVSVDLDYQAMMPPERLFHGTATRFLDSIMAQGLIKGERHHVHLSADRDTAIKVGQRHGKAVVIEVLARKMHDDGLIFFLSENMVWLTDHVPVDYLVLGGIG